jgi:hypothetical protein
VHLRRLHCGDGKFGKGKVIDKIVLVETAMCLCVPTFCQVNKEQEFLSNFLEICALEAT